MVPGAQNRIADELSRSVRLDAEQGSVQEARLNLEPAFVRHNDVEAVSEILQLETRPVSRSSGCLCSDLVRV